MECFKCKSKLSNDSKFCPRCGTVFSQDDVKKLGTRKENIFLSAYIKESKVNFHNISFGFLFFHFLYAFYKKMYVEGLISMLGFVVFISMIFGGINIIFNSMGFFFLPVFFLFLVSLFIYIYYVLNFNRIYIEKVIYRINKIIKNNPGATDDDIFILCKKDSKGNLWLPLISIIILLCFVLF